MQSLEVKLYRGRATIHSVRATGACLRFARRVHMVMYEEKRIFLKWEHQQSRLSEWHEQETPPDRRIDSNLMECRPRELGLECSSDRVSSCNTPCLYGLLLSQYSI
jgi:hypothetical protein